MVHQKIADFFYHLQVQDGKSYQLRINNNRSTMLSVKWDSDTIRVSLHRMFVDAPTNVMDALACYIKREHKVIHPTVKAFIEANLSNLNYSHAIDTEKLVSRGKMYDLKEVYEKLNNTYFDNTLDLRITWFGSTIGKNRSKLTLGLYYDSLKLIKIHQLLDNPIVPHFVIEYVVFHEMVHAVCPSYIDERGLNRSHGKDFKMLEKAFIEYEEALNWIRQCQNFFFVAQELTHYGRSQQMGKHQTSQR